MHPRGCLASVGQTRALMLIFNAPNSRPFYRRFQPLMADSSRRLFSVDFQKFLAEVFHLFISYLLCRFVEGQDEGFSSCLPFRKKAFPPLSPAVLSGTFPSVLLPSYWQSDKSQIPVFSLSCKASEGIPSNHPPVLPGRRDKNVGGRTSTLC